MNAMLAHSLLKTEQISSAIYKFLWYFITKDETWIDYYTVEMKKKVNFYEKIMTFGFMI